MPKDSIPIPIGILKAYIQGKVYEYFTYHRRDLDSNLLNIDSMNELIDSVLKIAISYLNDEELENNNIDDVEWTIAITAYTDFKLLLLRTRNTE